MGVLYLAPLDTGESVVELLGDRADLAAVYGHYLVSILELAHGRNYRRGTGTKSLVELALVVRLYKLVYFNITLGHLVIHGLQQLNAGHSRNAAEDRTSVKAWRDDLAVHNKEHVHRAYLVDVLLVYAVKPQHLGVALLFSFVLSLEGNSVVRRRLCEAGTARYRADIIFLNIYLYRSKSVRIVRANGGHDYGENKVLRGVYSKHGVYRKNVGTDIKGRSVGVRHPVLVDLYESFYRFNSESLVYLGYAEAVVGNVEPCHIFFGPEKLYPARSRSVGLHSLEVGLTVVQAH